MAIISIPTSVGGVTIPGLTNVPGGPLGVLFGNSKQLQTLQYPRDLGSATKGHIIQFSINSIQPTNFSQTSAGRAITNLFNGEIKQAGSNLVGAFASTAQEIQNIAGKAQSFWNKGQTFQIALNARKKTKVAAISLYMPDTVSFAYNAEYNKTSLVDAVTGAVDKISPLSTGSVLKSDLTKLAVASQGLAINDQQQILFSRIDFRTYDLVFTFTPYSRQETEQIKAIIKRLREAAAPQIQKGGSGLFFIVPNTVDIRFMLNGRDNPYITKVAESVIESIDVNYTPNGWSAHPDGSPTQIMLTMRLQELELIDKTKISAGF